MKYGIFLTYSIREQNILFKPECIVLELKNRTATPRQVVLYYRISTLSHRTNFRLFQTERVCRRHRLMNLMKIEKNSSNGLKTLWEKKKLLGTNNFSFSHSVFKRPVLQTRKNQGLFWKGLTFTKKSRIYWTEGRRLLKTLWEKEKMLVISIFSFSHNFSYHGKCKFHHRIDGNKTSYK